MTEFTKRLPIISVAAVCAAIFVLPALAWGAVREVGGVNVAAPPACQDENCRVLTRTTAFQLRSGNRANVSRVPYAGSLVAYTLNLPAVAEKYFKGLSAQYNGAPTARISILRQRKRKGATKYRYELISQSDVIQLKPYLNSSPSFVLSKPLAVRRGDMIGLTTDSWMPAFVSGGASSTDTWRASRPTGKCNVVKNKDGTVDYTNFSTPRMHERIGQIKQYNCGYTGARVLYHATVVDTPVKTTK